MSACNQCTITQKHRVLNGVNVLRTKKKHLNVDSETSFHTFFKSLCRTEHGLFFFFSYFSTVNHNIYLVSAWAGEKKGKYRGGAVEDDGVVEDFALKKRLRIKTQ